MTTPTRPFREAKKRWIIKAIRKHQREIDFNTVNGYHSLNPLHLDFIGRLQAELDARDIASLPVVVTWLRGPTPEPDGNPDVSDCFARASKAGAR